MLSVAKKLVENESNEIFELVLYLTIFQKIAHPLISLYNFLNF